MKKPGRSDERVPSEPEQLFVNELRYRYEEELIWQTREMWRLEYQSICDDAMKLYSLAREKNHCEHIISEELCSVKEVEQWMRWRAARWMRIASKKSRGTSRNNNIISLVSKAKLAAAFLAIGCSYFGVEFASLVKKWERARSLLIPPDQCGVVRIPEDEVKVIGEHILDEDQWMAFESAPSPANGVASGVSSSAYSSTLGKSEGVSSTNLSLDETASAQNTGDDKYLSSRKLRNFDLIRPYPMKGWDFLDQREGKKWSDPRTCCLCHTCGDDDAGLPLTADGDITISTRSEGRIGRAGRLLPITDGTWIHTSCALWSPEVWESANGMVHNVEKARHRGNKMKCFGCGRPGPTIGCPKSNCPINYHFPCAVYCGAVMTAKQEMFCKNHKDNAAHAISPELASYEPMKPLRVAPREASNVSDIGESKPCLRIGSLVVHSLGTVEQHHDGFHTKHHITPPGYTATRIFWSFKKTLTRTLYLMKVDRSPKGNPVFSIRDAENPNAVIRGKSAEEVYSILMRLVLKANESVFSCQGDLLSLKPVRRQKNETFGLNGPQVSIRASRKVRRFLLIVKFS